MENLARVRCYDLESLYRRFKTKGYSCYEVDQEDERIIDKCIALFESDYKCEILKNKGSAGSNEQDICYSYPSRIPIPTYERVGFNNQETIEEESKLFQNIIEALSQDELDYLLQCAKYSTSTSVQHRFQGMEQAEGNAEDIKHLESLSLEERSTKNKRVNASVAQEKIKGPENLLDVPFLQSGSSRASENADENYMLKDVAQTKYHFRNYSSFSSGARCWYRFPVPVIFCKGKYICRSSSLSVYFDVTAKEYIHNLALPKSVDKNTTHDKKSMKNPTDRLGKIRYYDIKLLETLGVSTIVDLMVEYNKAKLYGFLYTASSEKEDVKNHKYASLYSNFNLDAMPFPGCEHFKKYTYVNFNKETMADYEWEPSLNTAPLNLHEREISSSVCSDWSNYKKWKLRTLTANYLRLMQKYILDPKSKETGLLVHCISGWDRTPLFISLLRLSLWADGHIHPSLNAEQMLYLTLAYDWYLFGHKLSDRLDSKENILRFCFDFLEDISNDDFVEYGLRERPPSTGGSASEAYDGAPDATETPASSFGSIASFASSSSSAPPPSVSNAPPIKSSPIKPHPVVAPNWPYKENGFSFKGIAENKSVNLVSEENNFELGTVSYTKRSSPVRSPLRERNKKSPKSKSSPSGGRGRVTLNGVGDLMSKRSRKSSVTESPNLNESLGSLGEHSFEVVDQENLNYSGCDSPSDIPLKASNPVPVPGVRSRNSSSSESISSSWNVISRSTESVLSDPFDFNCFAGNRGTGYKFVPVNALTDSCNTVKEGYEELSSSLTSSQESIRVIDRQGSFGMIREAFIKLYDGLSLY